MWSRQKETTSCRRPACFFFSSPSFLPSFSSPHLDRRQRLAAVALLDADVDIGVRGRGAGVFLRGGGGVGFLEGVCDEREKRGGGGNSRGGLRRASGRAGGGLGDANPHGCPRFRHPWAMVAAAWPAAAGEGAGGCGEGRPRAAREEGGETRPLPATFAAAETRTPTPSSSPPSPLSSLSPKPVPRPRLGCRSRSVMQGRRVFFVSGGLRWAARKRGSEEGEER